MTWFKVDDKLHSHPKVQALSEDERERLEAMGLWTLVGSHAADYLTDGVIDRATVRHLAPRRGERLAQRLVEARLWHPHERGWVFHDWADHQPLKADVLAERERKAEAGRRGGLRSGEARASRSSAPPPPPVEAEAKQVLPENEAGASRLLPEVPNSRSRPVPTRPEPAGETPAPPARSRARAKPAKLIDPAWLMPDELAALCREHGLDPERVRLDFVDYWLGEGKPKADWTATCRNRIRMLIDRQAPDARPSGVVPIRRGPPPQQRYEPPPGPVPRYDPTQAPPADLFADLDEPLEGAR